MTESESQIVSVEEKPVDTKVISVEIVNWYPSEARDAGFPELLTKDLTEYSVAVGLNSKGDRVGAAVLGRYVRYPGGKGIMHRAVLREKGNKIFSLTETASTPIAE